MMTDPIADMLTRIRNAQMARLAYVDVPLSTLKKSLAEILREEKFINDISVLDEEKPTLRLALKYYGKQPAIQSLVRMSTPGHRYYCKADELPRILNDYGIAIVSTSQGMMSNKKARELGIGGEVICSVY